MASYCTYCRTLPKDYLDRKYHDTRYGKLEGSDDELFGRLILEIMQAGLSWSTILQREEGIRAAFSNFEVLKIATFGEDEIIRLKADPRIIRNELKIRAIIYNAEQIQKIQSEFGSFRSWLVQKSLSEHDLAEWLVLFKKQFKFVGKEIVKEFLMSLNLLPGAHDIDCYVMQNA